MSEESQPLLEDGDLGYLYIQQPDHPMSAYTDWELELLERGTKPPIANPQPSGASTTATLPTVTPEKTEKKGPKGHSNPNPDDIACHHPEANTSLPPKKPDDAKLPAQKVSAKLEPSFCPSNHKVTLKKHDDNELTVWHPTANVFQGPATDAKAKELERKEHPLMTEEQRMRWKKRKAKEEKTAALESAARARKNAKDRLQTKFALSLESPSDNRKANRELGTELRNYARAVLKHSDANKEHLAPLTFRDEKLMRDIIPSLCDVIETPCFRVSSMDIVSLKLCFPILQEVSGLAELVKTFFRNLGFPFAILVKPDYVKFQYYYLTRWLLKEEHEE